MLLLLFAATLPPTVSSFNALFQSSQTPLPCTFEYTHLEVNGMLWRIPEADLSLVIDPIASQLDFGIPLVYRANKKVLGEAETLDKIVQAQPTHCLLSQSLDDHTHLATLSQLIQRLPDLLFLVAPSAQKKARTVVPAEQLTVVKPGESVALSKNAVIAATQGALVGPPWQARENGWLLQCQGRGIYTEPHADVLDSALQQLTADLVISPIKQQALPAVLPASAQFKLVYGGARTLEICQLLRAKTIIPLGNGELTTEGILAPLVKTTGSRQEFEKLAAAGHIAVQQATPGVPLKVRL